MKKLITILLVCLCNITYAQTTINPDTICAGSSLEDHFVTNTVNSTYNWTVDPSIGSIVSGQGTNNIISSWGVTPGLYSNAITVIESSVDNCVGNPVTLDVYILQLTFASFGVICENGLPQNLSGSPSGGTYSGVGVVGNTFDPLLAGVGTHLVTYSLANCYINWTVTVSPPPTTGPIQHY